MSLFAQCFQFAMILVLLLSISFLCWWFSQSAFWRGRWAGEKDEIIPDTAPRLALRWRALQGAAIAVVGLSVLYFLGASGDGPLAHFGEMRTAKAMIVGAVTVAAALGILLGAFLALAGGTGLGCWLAALTLFVFGALNANTWPLINWLCPGDSAEPQMTYDFQVSDNLPGVEIWVNNVCLGKTPLSMTREAFLDKVPYRTEIPGAVTRSSIAPRYFPNITDPTWNRFQLAEPFSWNPEKSTSRQEPVEYFARARIGGEWGKSSGGSSGGGSGSNYTVGLGFSFPALEAKINALLDQARAPGFRPTPEWFKALEALNPPAWRMLRDRAANDPKMQSLREAWAAWHYGLDRATTPDAAWQAMEAIAREADANRAFDTDSPAGQAVALLAPKLDLERLVGEAARLLRKHRTAGWGYSWSRAAHPVFSSRIEPGVAGTNAAPMRAYVIAQAVMVVGERVKAKTGKFPPLYQARLAPEIVRYASGGETFLAIAATYGGAEVEKYLLRQPWQKPADWRDFENTTYAAGSVRVNKWLKLLAGMDNDIGRRFRAEHRQEVLDLARQVMGTSSPPWVTIDSLAFLFIDPQLALEFWPTFKSRAAASRSVADMEYSWKYLVRTEPATTLEMYQENWREFLVRSPLTHYYMAFSELDRLPAKRRREVLTVIQAETQKELSGIDPARRRGDPRAFDLDQILWELQKKLKKP